MLPLFAALALADEPTFEVKPVVAIRERLEIDSGRDAVATPSDWFVTQRVRAGLQVAWTTVSARAVVQDVRYWGEEAHTLNDYGADGFDLHEGWIAWGPGEVFDLTVGRQEWILHEQRLIGATDWHPAGRSFDGVRAAFAGSWAGGDVAVARLADPNTPAHALGGGILAWGRGGWVSDVAQIDAVLIIDSDESTDRVRETAGAWGRWQAGQFSGRAEGYGQFGSVGDASIGAFMFGAQVTWTSPGPWKPAVTLWYDFLSGDADPTTGTVAAFDTLYATNHKFYGIMDVATFRTGGAVDGRGLQDAAVKFSMNPIEALQVRLDVHAFLAANAQGGTVEIGEEIDLWATATLAKPLSLEGGGAMFRWAGGPLDAWGYLQLSFKL